MDGACAALRGIASHVGAGEAQVLADVGDQQGACFDVGGNGLAIDFHGYFDGHAVLLGVKHPSAAVSFMPLRLRTDMRLLIVEDDAPLASGLQRILEAEGHAVDVTARGEEAVLAAAQEKFDLVILDNVLEHVRDRRRTLDEAHRVLAPQGLLYMVTPKPFALHSLVSDPHYQIPGLVLLPPRAQKWYFERIHSRGRGEFAVESMPEPPGEDGHERLVEDVLQHRRRVPERHAGQFGA